MAKEKPLYEVIEDGEALLNKLISLNEDKFGHIDSKMIRMTMVTNKEAPESPPYHKIIRINNPVAMFCSFRYVIVTWQSVWESFTEDQRGLMLLAALHAIEPDEDEPKVRSPDVKDFSEMLRTFGVDYFNNEEIKGLFVKPVDWSEGFTPEQGADETEEDEDNAFGE